MVVKPLEEWELSRTVNGTVVSNLKDLYYNTSRSYTLTEFSRGDVVRLEIIDSIIDKGAVKKGDTIGFIISNEEQRRLIQLMGQLEVLKSELLFYTTGQKPEDVTVAERKVALAEQELATQRKIIARAERLIKDSVISKEQFDLEWNDFKVKELTLALAKEQLLSVDTGDKPEQAIWIETKMEVLNNEINQIKKRISLFTIVSPISGAVTLNHADFIVPQELRLEPLLKVVSTDRKIGLVPILLKDLPFFDDTLQINLLESGVLCSSSHRDNSAQLSLWKPYVYYIASLPPDPSFFNGDLIDVELKGKSLGWLEYLKKIIFG